MLRPKGDNGALVAQCTPSLLDRTCGASRSCANPVLADSDRASGRRYVVQCAADPRIDADRSERRYFG